MADRARWSTRILFASALVLAFAGGEWRGRRSAPPVPACTDPDVVRRAFDALAGDTVTFKPSGEVEIQGPHHWASYNGMQMVWPDEIVVSSGGPPDDGPDEDSKWLCAHSAAYRRARGCVAHPVTFSVRGPSGAPIAWPSDVTSAPDWKSKAPGGERFPHLCAGPRGIGPCP